jgi:hypothetical protein
MLTQMAEQLQMSPQFLTSMFGEFSYWAPGDFALHDNQGRKQSFGKSAIIPGIFMYLANN